MNDDTPEPVWNADSPYDSLLEYARWLHREAVEIFLDEKRHGYVLFLFSESEGLVSFNPVPHEATEAQILAGVRKAVRDNDIYGVVAIMETWTYFPKTRRDHTVIQLLHNEMGVADLKDEDKAKCLTVRVECRSGDGVLLINRINATGEDVSLGPVMQVALRDSLKQDRYFV